MYRISYFRKKRFFIEYVSTYNNKLAASLKIHDYTWLRMDAYFINMDFARK